MTSANLPVNEEQRLNALRAFNILDTLPEQAFDDIVFIASQICNTSIALISLVDRDRQWFKAKWGLDEEETSRDFSFCAHAIHNPDEFFEVPDTLLDDRFSDNPFVEGAPGIRFYAAIPLKVSEDMAIGTLCVADQKGGNLSEEQIKGLKALSRQVMMQLELRKDSVQQWHHALQLSHQLDANQSRLAEAELKYEHLYEESPVMMASINSHTGLIMKCNQMVAKTLGYSQDELMGQHVYDIYHPDCHDEVRAAFHTFQETGSLKNKRLILRAKGGGKIYVELNVNALYGDYGTILFSNSVWRDITDLVAAEQQLKAANAQLARKVEDRTAALKFTNQRLNRVLEGSQDAIWDWVDLGKKQWWSPNFLVALGYGPNELQADSLFTFTDFLHPEDEPNVMALLQTAQVNHEPFRFECRLKAKGGAYNWFNFRGKVSTNAYHEVIGLSGSASNVQEQKSLEKELSAAEKFLTKVTGLVPNVIYVFNQQTMSNEYANREIGRVMGYSEDEVQALGANLMPKLCHPDDLPAVLEHFKNLKRMKDNEFLELEYRIRHKNGRYRWLLSIDTVFERDDKGRVVKHIGVANDITKIKEIEAERQQQNKMLALKNNELQQLAYIATHDLKVPILNIKGHFSFLKTQLMEGDEAVKESVGYVEESIVQYQKTIKGLTKLLKIKSEAVVLERVDLQAVFKELKAIFLSEVETLGGHLTIDLPSEVFISGNKTFCLSIYKNLLGNAIKYRSSERNLAITITGKTVGRTVVVKVEDNGIGMDLDLHKDKLFGMFKRFHNHVEGSGMGLHMTKLMMESQEGSIGLTSTVGQGTLVTTTFKRLR